MKCSCGLRVSGMTCVNLGFKSGKNSIVFGKIELKLDFIL